jgi:hypothetical protein
MVLEMSSCKEGGVGEQYCETQPMGIEGWMPSKPEAEALGQCDVKVPFTEAIIDIAGMSHRRRTSGVTPVGYSGSSVT